MPTECTSVATRAFRLIWLTAVSKPWYIFRPAHGMLSLTGGSVQSSIIRTATFLESSTNPWDRRSGESGKAYAAFLAYRDLGIERSLTKAAEKVTKKKQTLHRWSVQWDWPDRSY